MTTKKGRSGGGIGFVGALQLLFIGLKLAGCIDWSWWMVFVPLFVWLGLMVMLFALIGVIAYVEDEY